MPRRSQNPRREFRMVVEESAATNDKTCICESPPTDMGDLFWIACEADRSDCPGNGWYHCVCVDLPNIDHANIIEEYHCTACRTKILADLDMDTPSPTPSPPADDDEFVVEAIVDHSDDPEVPGTLAFMCKWDGYDSSENSWVNEKELQACYHLVNRYRTSKKLGPSPLLEPIGGAVLKPDIKFNQSNWVSIDVVIRMIQQNMQTACYRTNLPIVPLDLSVTVSPAIPVAQPDALFVVLHEAHFIPVLYLSDTDRCIACESQNVMISSPDSAARFTKDLGRRVKFLRCAKGMRADHCGSGAVVLALELLRRYRTQDFECDLIAPPAGILEKVKRKLHPSTSAPAQKSESISNRLVRFNCRYCQDFSRLKQRDVLSHERRCSLRP